MWAQVALLDALMPSVIHSVVVGYPSWADYDQVELANERFRTTWKCHYW